MWITVDSSLKVTFKNTNKCYKDIYELVDEMVATISSGFTGDKVLSYFILFTPDFLMFLSTVGGG